MPQVTEIQWADASWNPTRGCSRVSAGCVNCYAERVAARFSGDIDAVAGPRMGQRSGPFLGFATQTKAGPRWTGRVELVPDALDWPLRVRRPAWVRKAEAEGRRPRVFVNSMSDLFHERLSDEAIAAVFGVMAAKPEWDFLVLTKRPERMRRWFEWAEDRNVVGSGDDPADIALAALWNALAEWPGALHGFGPDMADEGEALCRALGEDWPLPNVWLGTSVENQWAADERIPHLLATPAAVRFVSYEPAIAAVDFEEWLLPTFGPHCARGPSNLNWLIWGGESGPGARPNDLAWGRSARDACRAAGVAFFAKQLGSRPIDDYMGAGVHAPEDRRTISAAAALGRDPINVNLVMLRDPKGGDMGEWPEDLRVREFPNAVRS